MDRCTPFLYIFYHFPKRWNANGAKKNKCVCFNVEDNGILWIDTLAAAATGRMLLPGKHTCKQIDWNSQPHNTYITVV